MSVVIKECTVFGDMSSDRTSENYPQVPICEDCIKADHAAEEDSQIVSVGRVVTGPDASCDFCGASAEDEAGESL